MIEEKSIKYQKGGKDLKLGDDVMYAIPLGVSSNGFALRIADGKVHAYICNDKGLPMKEASDGDDLGTVSYWVARI